MKRVASGIPGFDELVDGGIPYGSIVLVSGGPGSGKTTFCSQFLWEGVQDGETCLYITLEESPEEIRNAAARFGWDFSAEDNDGALQVMYIDPATDTEQAVEHILEAVDQVDPDRLVIDSISVIEAYWDDEKTVRGSIHNLIRRCQDRDLTALMTAEVPENDGKLSRYGIAEFVVDGVIAISGMALGESMFRSIQIVKMRKTGIVEELRELTITDDGLTVGGEDAF